MHRQREWHESREQTNNTINSNNNDSNNDSKSGRKESVRDKRLVQNRECGGLRHIARRREDSNGCGKEEPGEGREQNDYIHNRPQRREERDRHDSGLVQRTGLEPRRQGTVLRHERQESQEQGEERRLLKPRTDVQSERKEGREDEGRDELLDGRKRCCAVER